MHPIRSAFVASIALGCAQAWAADDNGFPSLQLSGNRFWVVISSSRDLDMAISQARRYDASKSFVVGSINGWYGVIQGPIEAQPGSGRAILDSLIRDKSLPKDIYFTAGKGFTSGAWRQTPVSSKLLSFDGKANTALTDGDLRIDLSSVATGDGLRAPTAKGFVSDTPVFNMMIAENPSEEPKADATLVSLDRKSEPQIVFSYYWQGAHCCTITKIATLMPDQKWKVIEGETLDGDGYALEDIEGNGKIELVSNDQAFLYAFGPYSDSNSPLKIHELQGDQIVDVTSQPAFQHRLVQDLDSQESRLKPDDPEWHSNGFLAGWVASKMLVGQGDEAWSRMLSNYDHNPDDLFAPKICAAGGPIGKCADDSKVAVAFPVALKRFLTDEGYITNPDKYPVKVANTEDVTNTQSASNSVPPTMTACSESSETVRKLIYQQFVGRKAYDDEYYSLVRLQDDMTVEANEPDIRKVTCAVSYDMDIKPLIGHVAENGDIQRAAILTGLMRRSGQNISNRVRFTVKPTAKQGQTFVELLR